jgi:hypothetical protein
MIPLQFNWSSWAFSFSKDSSLKKCCWYSLNLGYFNRISCTKFAVIYSCEIFIFWIILRCNFGFRSLRCFVNGIFRLWFIFLWWIWYALIGKELIFVSSIKSLLSSWNLIRILLILWYRFFTEWTHLRRFNLTYRFLLDSFRNTRFIIVFSYYAFLFHWFFFTLFQV